MQLQSPWRMEREHLHGGLLYDAGKLCLKRLRTLEEVASRLERQVMISGDEMESSAVTAAHAPEQGRRSRSMTAAHAPEQGLRSQTMTAAHAPEQGLQTMTKARSMPRNLRQRSIGLQRDDPCAGSFRLDFKHFINESFATVGLSTARSHQCSVHGSCRSCYEPCCCIFGG
eukprot:s777_g56.t1